MRAVAAAVLLLLVLATVARAAPVVLSVESATGGIWRPGRFSPILVTVSAGKGDREIRARLEPGKVVVGEFHASGGTAVVEIPLLPEVDATTVEVDTGDGFRPHSLALRRADPSRPVLGIPVRLAGDPGLAESQERLGWIEVRLPRRPSAALRDVCDLVVEELPLTDEAVRRAHEFSTRGPELGGPRVARWLEENAAGAAVPPGRVGGMLPLLAFWVLFGLSVVVYGRRRGWSAFRVVLTTVVLAVLATVGVSVTGTRPMPHVAARGLSLVRADGARTDLLLLSARGRETIRFGDIGRGEEIDLIRPVADETGRIDSYTLRGGNLLAGIELGPGRHRVVRMDRSWIPTHPPREEPLPEIRDGATIGNGEAVLLDGTHLKISDWFGQFWVGEGGQGAIDAEGRLLMRIVRPGRRDGLYGFLREPPFLDRYRLGVETAEIPWAVLIP